MVLNRRNIWIHLHTLWCLARVMLWLETPQLCFLSHNPWYHFVIQTYGVQRGQTHGAKHVALGSRYNVLWCHC